MLRRIAARRQSIQRGAPCDFFFFQAEDGIRDLIVTGVQPCALPISVTDRRSRRLGQALYSPRSESRLRLLTRGREPVDAGWWGERIAAAAGRRAGLAATAFRVVHAEGDGLPSLVVDRYGPYVVAQLLSAGVEQRRGGRVAGVRAAPPP